MGRHQHDIDELARLERICVDLAGLAAMPEERAGLLELAANYRAAACYHDRYPKARGGMWKVGGRGALSSQNLRKINEICGGLWKGVAAIPEFQDRCLKPLGHPSQARRGVA
jgi:hypothetical protein